MDIKFGEHEYIAQNPPKINVYRKDSSTRHYTYDGSYDGAYNDRLSWNEDATYVDIWEYDSETLSPIVGTTLTGGSASGQFEDWTDDGDDYSRRDLSIGQKYAIWYDPATGNGIAFEPFVSTSLSYAFYTTNFPHYWWSSFTYPPVKTADLTFASPTSATATGSGNYGNDAYHVNWDYSRTDTLSDLYTTAEFECLARANLASIPLYADPDWQPYLSPVYQVAARLLSDDETTIELDNGRYRMKFQGESGAEYELKWIERFIAVDSATFAGAGPTVDTIIKEKIVATGQPQYSRVHFVDPPLSNGYVVLVLPKVGCEECAAGSDTSENGSVDFSINLGRSRDGGSAGRLFIYEPFPTNTLATPSSLRCDVGRDVLINYDWSTYQIRQVASPESIANVVLLTNYTVITNSNYTLTTNYSINNYAYYIEVYHPGDFPDLQAPPTGSPFAVWRIENPDPSDTTLNHLNIVKTADGLSVTNAYIWSDIDQGWTLETGNGLRKESKAKAVDPATGDETEAVVVKDQQNQTVFTENRRFHTYDDPLGRALLETTVDPQGTAKTTTYLYFTDPVADGTNYGKIKQIVRDTGAWTRYEYNAAGLLSKEISSFLNAATNAPDDSCRVLEYYYSPVDAAETGGLDPNTPRTTIEKLLGREVSRRYTVVLPGEHREIQCAVAGAPANDPNNLVTVTKAYTLGDDRALGKPHLTNYPDGTREVNFYEYFDDPGGSYVTNTVLHGEADPNDEMNVLGGTRTVSATTDTGHPISTMTFDIASGLMTSSEVYSDFDAFQRPGRVTQLDGTHTDTTYSCCGVDTVTDRDGSSVSYEYDALKRRWAEHRLVSPTDTISLLSSYDPQGNVLSTTRVGTNGSTILLSTNMYDNVGQLVSTTDALNQTTRYTNFLDVAGQTVRITTYPDLSTRVEVHFKDGSLQSVTGTAAHPVRYEYGVETSGADAGSYFVKEIELNADGTDSFEWTKSYRDAQGHAYKSLYADGAFSQSIYNQKGQLEKQIDPDGVVTLFAYNSRGELVDRAVDMNRNGVIDYNSTDRVARTIADVAVDQGTAVRRSQTFVWNVEGSANALLTSVTESSVDGLQSWQTGFGLTNYQQTVYNGNGSRTLTAIAPDNSTTVSEFLFGRLQSTTRRDSNGVQIGSVSFSYDSHGRQNTVSDARTGATTYAYDDLDRVVSVTTPVPGPGQNAQTTINYFDNMGRVWKTLLPDSTSVTNEYYTTGELKKTYGSRTYPVQYTFDARGRMKTMTTWQSFAANTGAAVTTWNYDGLRGFLTNKVFSGSTPGPSYTYKPSGRLQTRTWARGITTTYGYNNGGNLETVDYSDTTPDVTYVYNRLARTKTVTEGTNVCSYAYNDAGQLLSDSTTAGILNGLILTNGYDGLLRRTNLTINTQPSTINQSFGFDAASRLHSVSDGVNSATYSYLANSPLVQNIVFQQNGSARMTTTKQYDYLNRLTSIASIPSASGQSPLSNAYAYNAANQRTAITNADNSRWVYTYDTLGQVTFGKKYWADGTPVAGEQYEYGFDDIGNRSSTKAGGDQSGAGLRPASYSVNLLNQQSSRTVPAALDIIGSAANTATVTVNNHSSYRKGDYFRDELIVDNAAAAVWLGVTNLAVLNDGTNPDIIAANTGNAFVPKTPESFGYDADGNMTNDGRWSFTWDGENRLVTIQGLATIPSDAKKKLDFNYDYRSRRVQKIVSTWNGSTYVPASTNRFLYDDWNLISEVDATYGVIRSYMWGLDQSGSAQGAGGVGGLLAVSAGTNGVHFVAYDGNGNLGGLIGAATATATAEYEYGPFGELIRATGPMAKANPFRFSTKYQDDETDFLYYGYRYYNPSTGRWLSRDPIEEMGGLDLYSFVLNSPTAYFDSNGLYTLGEWGQITGGLFQGLGQGAGNVGGAVWGLVKSPYTVTKGLSSTAGTLSTEYGRDELGRKLSLAKLLSEKFAKDPCFRKQVLDKLGAEGKHYFTDPYKLSELLSNVGVAAATAGLGAAAEGGQLAEKLAEVLKLLDKLSPEGKALAELANAAKTAQGLLPQFARSTIDDVVASAARARSEQITEGARAIAKKLGHAESGGYSSAFDGVAATPSSAETLIRSIMSNPSRTFYGDRVIDIYNAVGQGVRVEAGTGRFLGFLEGALSRQ